MSYLRFDIPSTITDNHKIKLNIVVDGDSTLNGGFRFRRIDKLAGEKAQFLNTSALLKFSTTKLKYKMITF